MFTFIHATFDDSQPRGPSLMDAIVATIKDASRTGPIIKHLEQAIPAEKTGIGHLKRLVKNPSGQVCILIGPASDQCSSFLNDHASDLVGVEQIPIPADLPRKDVDDPTLWSKHWQIKLSLRLNSFFSSIPVLSEEDRSKLEVLCHDVLANDDAVILYDDKRSSIICRAVWDTRPVVGSAVMKAVQAAAEFSIAWNADHDFYDSYYFLTNCWAVMTREPTIGDAMALLHSRVARVVYCKRTESHGALGSRCVLHLHPGLNHHFEVYEYSRRDDGVVAQ